MADRLRPDRLESVDRLLSRVASGSPGLLIGWFIKDASAASYQQVRFEEVLRGAVVGDAMIEGVETVPASISVAEAAREHFNRTGHGSYPVTRGEAVIGLLCLKDVLRLSAEERESTSVQGVMRPLADIVVSEPDEPLVQALATMARGGTARLLVLNRDRLVGLLTMNDVMRRVRVREELAG